MPWTSPFTKLLEALETGAAWRAALDLEPSTDYYAPGGTDVPIADGGTGASTAAAGFAALAATSIAFTGDISPAQITGNQNNYNPTGLATASRLRISSDTYRQITGLAGGTDGRVLFITNVGASQIDLVEQSGSSDAVNQFRTVGAAWAQLLPGATVILIYDGTSALWDVHVSNLYPALQAQQEAAVDAWRPVTAAMQHYHPSAAKVRVQGTPNSTTIISSYNVTSLGDTAAGQQTVTIATDLSSAAYTALVTVGDTSTTLALSATVMTKAAGSYIMNAVVEAGSGADPAEDWNSVVFGDQ